jgi:pimeloyl-ACP methyl ester carboxylesterase
VQGHDCWSARVSVLNMLMGRLLTVYRFFGLRVEEQMKTAASNIEISEVFEECGHSLSLEQPERLAKLLRKFLS